MGSNSKRFLEGEAVPTIFSFAPEPARKRWESSMSRAEKRGKKLCIEEAISSHDACSSHGNKEDIQELEHTSEKCIGTEPLITFNKAVGKHTSTKSVRTQYNPLNVSNKSETTETCKNDCLHQKEEKKPLIPTLLSAKDKSTNCYSQRICSFFRWIQWYWIGRYHWQ